MPFSSSRCPLVSMEFCLGDRNTQNQYQNHEIIIVPTNYTIALPLFFVCRSFQCSQCYSDQSLSEHCQTHCLLQLRICPGVCVCFALRQQHWHTELHQISVPGSRSGTARVNRRRVCAGTFHSRELHNSGV